MLIPELTIGIILLVVGLSLLGFVVYGIKTSENCRLPILEISEVLATVAIGVFYIVCSCLIAGNELAVTTEVNVETTTIPTTTEIFFEVEAIDDVVNEEKNATQAADQFLQSYQKFFHDIISNRVRNDSVGNFYYNNRFYNREKRDMEEVAVCSKDDEEYYKYLMMAVSFIYGLSSLINKSLDCKCNKKEEKTDAESLHSESSGKKIFIKPSDDSMDIDKIERHVFGSSNEIKSDTKSLTSIKIDDSVSLRNIVRIIATWLLPIIYGLIIYATMKIEINPLVLDEKLSEPTEIINFLDKPMNITNTEGKKVNEIINKIYQIVASATPNDTTKQTYPPVMYEIINYFNNKSRRERNLNQSCENEKMPVKLHTLIIFIIAYVTTLLYTKNKHTKSYTADDSNPKTSTFGKQIGIFALLWLPCVLEMFARTYLMNYQPNVLSDVCLGVGNASRVAATALTVKTLRDELWKKNDINPVP